MKRAFILFWHGLTALLVGIANWFTTLLGMKDDSRYGKFLRRTVGSCFAFLMLLLTLCVSIQFYHSFCYWFKLDSCFNDLCYETQHVSHTVCYYSHYSKDGFLKTADGKKTLTGIKWIAMPLGTDSLVCYSDGKKRGYFNMYTGKPVIEAKYNHAWVFSDGLAAVEEGGRIKFIDSSGKVVIDPQLDYMPNAADYVFHNNSCIAYNQRSRRFGLLDKQGKWVLEPEYASIESSNNLWLVDNGESKCVLDSTLNPVTPFVEGNIWINSKYISITLSNHIMQRYEHSGRLINDFYISDVSLLTYDSDELLYASYKRFNEEGVLVSETEDTTPVPVKKMAKCRSYEAECGWYGLMSADGKVITPPSYCHIKAIGYDMYLCRDNNEDGVILNGKGERID